MALYLTDGHTVRTSWREILLTDRYRQKANVRTSPVSLELLDIVAELQEHGPLQFWKVFTFIFLQRQTFFLRNELTLLLCNYLGPDQMEVNKHHLKPMINLLYSTASLMKSVTNHIHLLSAFFNIVGGTLIHVNSIINCLTFVHERCCAVSVWDIFALLLRNIFTFLTKIVYMKNVFHPKNFLP